MSSLTKIRALSLIGAASILIGTMPKSATAYINGFDVYSGDGTVTWSSAKAGGYDFAFVKATEGVNFVDSRFATNMTGANAAGVYVGPYHFVRADSKNGVAFTSYDGQPFTPNATNIDPWLDATSEADDFIDAIRPYYYQTGTKFYLQPVADVERYPNFGSSTLNKTFISNWTQLFSDTVLNALGVRPIIYVSESSANANFTPAVAGSHKLWEAWWKGTGTTNPPLQSNTPNWPPWSFWQWSDGTDSIAQANQVPGTVVSVDRDVFSGTAAQLAALKLQLVQGDYNHNTVVDGGDYILWRKQVSAPNYSTYKSVNLGADGDSSDVVDAADYTYWRAHYGKLLSGSGSGSELASGTIPEPWSLSLLLSGVFCKMLARPRR